MTTYAKFFAAGLLLAAVGLGSGQPARSMPATPDLASAAVSQVENAAGRRILYGRPSPRDHWRQLWGTRCPWGWQCFWVQR